PGPIAVMQHHYPDVPNLGDLKEIDWASLGHIDIITAGYPWQPLSNAGLRKGIEDERHIWPYIAHGLRVLRPSLVVLENVSAPLPPRARPRRPEGARPAVAGAHRHPHSWPPLSTV